MKLLICWALVLGCSNFSFARESGPDNGTDRVKVTFQQARVKLLELTKDIHDLSSVRALEPIYVDWSHQLVAGTDRWTLIKYYLKGTRFDFQQAPCGDQNNQTASICFFNQNPSDPYVMISLSRNLNTTVETAMAMLVHEMGHFAGEQNHFFLDGFGAELVSLLMHPKEFLFQGSTTEIVPNVFQAKQNCENGSSPQAKNLIQQAMLSIQRQCQSAGIAFTPNRVSAVLTGTIHYVQGRGYDMRVTCAIESLYSLTDPSLRRFR